MKEKSLTELVLDFQNKLSPYDQVYNKISIFVYEYPCRIWKWDEDDRGDFFEFFMPKVYNLVKEFKYCGCDFEIYLEKMIRMKMKEFKSMQSKRATKERMFINRMLTEENNSNLYSLSKNDYEIFYTGESAPLYNYIPVSTPSEKKRIFYKVMMHPEHLDDASIKCLAELLDYDSDYIFKCHDELRAILNKKQEKITTMKAKEGSLFLSKLVIQFMIHKESDSYKRNYYMVRLGSVQRRLDKVRRKIEKYDTKISHNNLAKVLNVPKGTVDSALWYLKKRLEFQ